MIHKPPALVVKKLHPDAKLPTKAHETDEGYDIYCIEDVILNPDKPTKVKTGISARVRDCEGKYDRFWLQIEGKSGLASKGIFPIGGIVDSSYTGEICALMVLNGSVYDSYAFKKGDKIAQLVIREHLSFDVEEVEDLGDSDRGSKGFGSSGR